MKNMLLVSMIFAGLNGFAADQTPADASKSTIKIEDAAGKTNKVDGNIDEEITNAKLRAETGSKSKWSGSFTAIYNGGSLEKPMDKDRPNVSKDPIAPKVNMGGDVGVRYRMAKDKSLKVGVGYALERPFQEAKRGQVSNPSLSFNQSGKIGSVQHSFDPSVTYSTNSDEVEIGQLALADVSETLIYDFGGSRTSLGMAFSGTYTHFTKKNEIVSPKGQGTGPALGYQEDYGLAAYPFAEYAISDKVQLRTVFRPWMFSHAKTEDGWTFAKKPWTQSFGVVLALTRDIVLYPNFQWNWERWRRNDFSFAAEPVRATSTVGLNATINVF